jgi:hypothetical protein
VVNSILDTAHDRDPTNPFWKFPTPTTMNKTTVVIVFFVAALLAGLFLRMSTPPAAKPKEGEQTKEKETFMQRERGMPTDMQPVAGVSPAEAKSPILGMEPKPVPLEPYNMANDQELFQFEGNKVSADCCPSPFSTDRGCVCLTDKQINEFASRGGNRA